MRLPIRFTFDGELAQGATQQQGRKFIFNYPCADQLICYPYKVTLFPGFYQFECWGGGRLSSTYRYGAYTKGSIHFTNKTILYFHLGCSEGRYNVLPQNASFISSTFPSGATDIRTEPGSYEEFQSLKSRIMVAAGAGSPDHYNGKPGHGGTLFGETAIATQTPTEPLEQPKYQSGGQQNGEYNCTDCLQGTFGLSSFNFNHDTGGIGGGGYYTGATSVTAGFGGGGSSFISGFKGCNAIHENSSDFNSIIHTNQSIHYSGYIFYNTEMITGSIAQHYTSGKVVVTVLTSIATCQIKSIPKIGYSFSFFLLVTS